jgi:hypothetical protein
MLTRSAKAKGKMLEKEVAEKIIEAFNLTNDDVRTTVGSETGADVKLSAKAKVKFPFSIECKRRAKLDTLYKFYEQAAKHYPELIPAVVLRADRKEALIVLNLDFFLTIISNRIIKIKENQNGRRPKV